MTFRSVYLITLLVISVSYSLLLFAIYFPNWLEVNSIDSHNHIFHSEYGMFFVCTVTPPVEALKENNRIVIDESSHFRLSNNLTTMNYVSKYIEENNYIKSCKRFPDPRSQLCSSQPGLCDVWDIAASFSIFAVFVGAWCLAGLSEIVLGGSAHRSRGWAFLLVFLTLFGIAKFFILAIINRLSTDNQSPFKPPNNPIWWELQPGFSYRMTLISFIFDVSAIFFLLITHRTLRPAYQEIP